MSNDDGWIAAGKTRPYAEAKSAALALCAAALRARAAVLELARLDGLAPISCCNGGFEQ